MKWRRLILKRISYKYSLIGKEKNKTKIHSEVLNHILSYLFSLFSNIVYYSLMRTDFIFFLCRRLYNTSKKSYSFYADLVLCWISIFCLNFSQAWLKLRKHVFWFRCYLLSVHIIMVYIWGIIRPQLILIWILVHITFYSHSCNFSIIVNRFSAVMQYSSNSCLKRFTSHVCTIHMLNWI